MPSCITHQLIAEGAKRGFPECVREASDAHEDYFFLGALGPDSLFFLKPLSKKEMNLGRYLHRNDVYAVFLFFRRYLEGLEGREREQMTAYCAGFVSHYAADTVFHPFVYSYLETHETRGMVHQLIETDWDVYFAHTHRQSAVGWNFPFLADKINREGVLYAMYRELSEALARRPLKRRAFERGIKNFERYLRFFHKKSRAELWVRVERALRLKPRFSCLYPREKPDGAYLYGREFSNLAKGRGRTADELFRVAVSESARLVRSFFASEPLPLSEFNRSFLTAEAL